ncbi:amidohydrolase family protein [Chloroflexota bacterium]
MVIDVFCHIIPPRYSTTLEKMATTGKIPPFDNLFLREIQIPGMVDVEARFRLMDNHPEVREVISVTGPFLENVAKPNDAIDLARLVNDEVAELIAKYPDRFIAGVAFLPYNDIEATLREIDRAIKELKLRGIEIGTDVNGKPLDSPEFSPIYKKMEQYNLPVFLHPSKNRLYPDYPEETESKYNLFTNICWPHATSMAMLRLVHSGVLEKHPKLKFITHHAGGTVPYLAKRIEGSDQHKLPKPILDYLRLFYTDTAVQGNTPNLMCARAFFGADHLLFGTDFPFGNQNVMKTLRSIEEMDTPSAEKKGVLEDNARSLLHLTI